jgi:hypothetical protein
MATEFEATRSQQRQLVRREIHHVLRRGGLIGVEELLLLARAEGLSGQEILRLSRNWTERRWPRK